MTRCFDTIGPEGFGAYEVEWEGTKPHFNRVSRPPRGLLVPGFIDLHIHGASGIDFMAASAPEMTGLCRHLAELGYEGFLPTTITASAADVGAAASASTEPHNAAMKLKREDFIERFSR